MRTRPPASLDRVVIAAFAIVTTVVIGKTLLQLLAYYPYGVDLEIPLRAASRWVSGGEPYLPESFDVIAGPDLPFLYPPVVLPFLAPLLVVPRMLLFPVWTAFCVTAGIFGCRRLAIPWLVIPIVLAWAPFAEALLGGNIQVPLFAAFVAIVYRPPTQPLEPLTRDPADADRPLVVDGLLATVIGAIKVSLAHTWLYVLRRRPRSALAGAIVVGVVVIATLPLVGLDRWGDWLGQASRSGDPSWQAVGWPVSVLIGRPLGLLVTVITLVAVLFVPIRHAGAWLGLLTVIGAPSLHIFGLIFLLPAMLEVRRDVALAAALLIATYTDFGLVAGSALVAIAFVLAQRAPILAPRRRGPVHV